MNEPMGTHDGHRERMRERIRKEGLSSLAPHEVLEYFLFSFVPRRNTNDIAHRLLHRFGSLAGVLDADYSSLCEVEGMTANAALFLSQIPALLVQYKLNKALTVPVCVGNDAALYVSELIGNSPVERSVVLALDVKGNLLDTIEFDSESSDKVQLDLRRLVKELLSVRAAAVIVAHNHPSGDVSPSQQDLAVCQTLRTSLEPLSIRLLDCLIVGGGRAVSLMGTAEPEQKQRLAFAETAIAGTGDWHEIDAGEPIENEFNLLFNRNEHK